MDGAVDACAVFSRGLMPWLTEDQVSSEAQQKRRLLGESQPLIEAWIKEFEPENLAAYREQVRQQLERAQADAE